MRVRLLGRALSSAAQVQLLRAPLPSQRNSVIVVPGGASNVARSKVPPLTEEMIRVAIPRNVVTLLGHSDSGACPGLALNFHDRLALTPICPLWASHARTL